MIETAKKKKRIFKCKAPNLNIMVDRGGDVTYAIPGGGSKSERRAARVIKFRNYGHITDKEEDIALILKWAEEHSRDGIHEIVPETPAEKVRKAEEALNKQFEEVKRLKEQLKTDKKEAVEEKYNEECPHCDYVVMGVSQGTAKASLRRHILKKHRKAK